MWVLIILFAFTYLLVPVLSPFRPEDFASLPGYLDSPPVQRQYATWLSSLAFLALMYGYFGPLGPRLAALIPRSQRVGGDTWAGATALALFLLGVASVAAAVAIAGTSAASLSQLLTGDLRGEIVRSFSGRGYLSLGFAMLSLSVPCAAVWAAGRRTLPAWAAVSGATIVAEALLGGVVGSRLLALGIPIQLLAVVHYRVRRVPVPLVLATGGALLSIALVILARRGASLGDPLAAAAALSVTLDGYSFLVNALGRVHDFLWGLSIVQDGGLTYFPRAVWEGKPEIYGIVLAQERIVPGLHADVGGGATFPPGMVAEGYVNFGVFGALAFPLVAAICMRAIYVRLCERADGFTVVLFGWLLANQVSVMRGVGPMIAPALVSAFLLAPLLLRARHGSK